MSWKLMLPPQILAGQVNPVVLSAPTMVCQQLAGTFKAVAPSKPELNRSFAEPGASGDDVESRIEFRLKYCRSITNFRTCRPAVSGTVFLPTHWKVLQPPVLGRTTLPVTFTVDLDVIGSIGEIEV